MTCKTMHVQPIYVSCQIKTSSHSSLNNSTFFPLTGCMNCGTFEKYGGYNVIMRHLEPGNMRPSLVLEIMFIYSVISSDPNSYKVRG